MGFYVIVVNDAGKLGIDSGSPYYSRVQAHQKEDEYSCLAETIEADGKTEAKRIFRKNHPEYLNKNFKRGISEEELE